MNCLIIYATNSGSTEICANTIKEVLEASKYTVTTKNLVIDKPGALSGFDLILLGSPSWDYEGKEGMPHEDMMEFFKSNEKTEFNKSVRYAVFGCGDKSYAYFCHAVNVMEEFLKSKGITPFTQSLKIDSFYFDEESNINRVENWATDLSKLLK